MTCREASGVARVWPRKIGDSNRCSRSATCASAESTNTCSQRPGRRPRCASAAAVPDYSVRKLSNKLVNGWVHVRAPEISLW